MPGAAVAAAAAHQTLWRCIRTKKRLLDDLLRATLEEIPPNQNKESARHPGAIPRHECVCTALTNDAGHWCPAGGRGRKPAGMNAAASELVAARGLELAESARP